VKNRPLQRSASMSRRKWCPHRLRQISGHFPE